MRNKPTNQGYKIKHGYVGHPLYYVHQSMIARCERPTHKAYPIYGGRGISVCDQWHDMKTFAEWAYENGYTAGLSIERINNDGNYEPENCTWATCKQQAQNRRTTRYFAYNGQFLTTNEINIRYGICKGTFYSRFNNGWGIDRIIETPVNKSLSRERRFRKSESAAKSALEQEV